MHALSTETLPISGILRYMPLETQRRLLWLVGPCLAIALVAFAVLGRGGPGFFLFSLVGGCVLLVGVPLAQWAFMSSREYTSRPVAATRTAVLLVFGLVTLLMLFGPFNFW